MLFGQENHLNLLQMSIRAVVVFIFTLALIRIAGRRAFGMRAPLDNIILVLLGAILSRAVVGASPFIPTLGAGFVVVLMHRLFSYLSLWHSFEKWTKGESMLLYKEGRFIKDSMRRSLVSKEDIIEGVRLQASVNSFDNIEEVYMERNGTISAVKK